MESAPVPILKRPSSRGFSLVEMLVVLGIIAVITTVLLTGQSAFNQSLILTDTVYSMAFSAREAQSFGIASRAFNAIQNPGYGLHFSFATPGKYTLFADTTAGTAAPVNCPLGAVGTPEAKPGNCRYDAADGTVENYAFSRSFKIKQFCAKLGAAKSCSTDPTPLTSLDLVFTRPNTSTSISGYINGVPQTALFSCAEVTVVDPSGQVTKTMRVSSLGEISIGQSCS